MVLPNCNETRACAHSPAGVDEVCDLILEEQRAEPDEVDRNGLEDAEREVSAREFGPGLRHRADESAENG